MTAIKPRFFRNALTLCSVLAACALAAPQAEAQITNFAVQANGPNTVRATWNDSNRPAFYIINYDTQAWDPDRYRFKKVVAAQGKNQQSFDLSVRADAHIGVYVWRCTGRTGGTCTVGGHSSVLKVKTPPRPMSGFGITPGDMTLTVGNYSKSPRLQDRNGAAFSLGMSKGFDIDFTTSKTVDAQADTTTGTDVTAGWVLVTRNNKATTWPLTSLTNFSTYRIRMRYISTNGTSKWIVREGVPGAKLSAPDSNRILVHRRVSGLNVSGKTEGGLATQFSTPGAQNYLIRICRGSRDANCRDAQTSGSSGKLFEGLQGGARYHVRVRARSANGRLFDSDWSDWVGPVTKPTHRLYMRAGTYSVTEGGSQSHEVLVNEGGAITADLTVFARYDPPASGGTQSPAPAVIKGGTSTFPIVIPPDDDGNDPHRTFHIRELVNDDTYIYVMSSGAGQVAVTVLDDDTPTITGLSVTVNVRTLEVRWDAAAGPVTEYAVEYRKAADTAWQSVTRASKAATSEDILVEGGELYAVRVRANDGQTGAGNGWGPWVEIASDRTDYVVGWPAGALDGTSPVALDEGESGRKLVVAKAVPAGMTVTVAYGGSVSDLEGGRTTSFTVGKGEDLAVVLATPKTGDGNEPDETFTVTINAGSGYSIDSHAELTVTIRDRDPPSAPAVTQPANDDAQYLEWTAPPDGPIGRYQVQKLEIAGVGASVTEADWAGTAPTNVAPPTATRHRLPIPDGKTYVFRVRAHDGQSGDGNGWGEWSRPTEAVFPRASRGSWEVRARDARPGGIMEGYPRYEANFDPNAKPIGVVLRWDVPDLVAYKTRYATPHAGTKVGEPAAITWSGVRYDTRSGLTYDVAFAPSNDCPAGSARDFGSVQRTRNRQADGVRVGSAWMPNDCTYKVTVTANYTGGCPAGAGKCTREYKVEWPGPGPEVDPGVTPIVAASNTTAFEAVEKYGRSNGPATIAVRLYGGRGGRKIKWPGSGNSSCEGTGNDITVNVSTIGGTGSNTDGVAATPPADPRVTSHSSFSAYTGKWAIGGADYGAPTMNGVAITSLTFACEAGAEELRKEFTIPIMDDGIDDSGEVFAVKLEVATTTTRPGLVLPPGKTAKAAMAVSGGLVRVHILNDDYLSALVIEQRVGDEWSRLDYGTLTDTPSVTVPYETTHIRVTPTAGNAGSTLKVGSPLVSIASGGTSEVWALDVGANSFGIEVRESDGATKTYKISVTRQEQSALSANADLKALAVGTASSGNGPWTKLDIGEFSTGTTTYTVTVPHTATNVRIGASTADSNATHRKGPVASLRPGDGNYWTQNFALGEGANDLAVEVTAEDGKTKKTYTVTVTREARVLSSSADLSGLSAEAVGADGRWSALDLGTFSAGTTAYSVTVPYGTTQVRLSATAADSAAKVERGTGTALSVGSNELSVSVTAEDGKTRKTYTVTVTRGAAQPLTVAFENAPAEHDGGDPFAIDLRFSEALGEGGVAPTAASFAVQAGDVAGVEQVSAGLWRVRVQPNNWKDVTVTLSTPPDCAEAGAVCTEDGRALSNAPAATVGGPVRIRVEGARAKEDRDEALEFAVTLSRAASHEVSVDYATADDTAVAGADYTATSGTLVFAAGETAKTVSVPLLDDAVDEGKEAMHLHLSNPRGAYLRNIHRRAKGVIRNDDPLQRKWLSRFGRTVAVQTVEALEGRFAMGTEGSPRMSMTVAGQSMDLSRLGDGAAQAEAMTGLARAFGAPGAPAAASPGSGSGAGYDPFAHLSGNDSGTSAPARSMTGRELLSGTSFHFTTGDASGPGGAMTGWGKVLSGGSSGSFGPSGPGGNGLSLASETSTGVLGMDWERDRLLFGVALSRSVETGSASFAPTGSEYGIEGSLSMVTPYLQVRTGERLSFWSAVGSGSGSMSLSWDGTSQSADISMQLAAAGGRAELLRPGSGGGLALVLKTDAFFVRAESARVSTPGVGNLASARGDASRVRALLEGSRSFALAGGGALEPSLSVGLRHDGGDAQTGSGVEAGAGLVWSDPSAGLTSDLRVYGLAAHESGGYEEWGASGSLRVAPDPSGRGLSLSLTPSWGAQGQSGRLWGAAPGSLAGAGAAGDGGQPGMRLDTEFGYGLPLSGGLTGTPYAGLGLGEADARDWRLGLRFSSDRLQSFTLGVEATRREAANDNTRHGVMVSGALRW